MLFRDRADAGTQLATKLIEALPTRPDEDPVVLGIPRGGVPVAAAVAEALALPLDIVVVRKLGVPSRPELAMGAVGEGEVRVVDRDVIRRYAVHPAELARVERRERAEVDDRARRLRGTRAPLPLAGRTALVVDDGVATGSSLRAACLVVRAHGANRVVVAVPVAPDEALAALADVADEIVCLRTPRPFFSVGQWYRDFTQTSDAEVTALLLRGSGATGSTLPELVRDEELSVLTATGRLAGRLTLPRDAQGLVYFAHGSGSSRHSPRNQFVAQELNRARLGTLLLDLLTPAEEVTRASAFDVERLASRLSAVARQVSGERGLDDLPVGYFGASTGAAAALIAAAEPGSRVDAVVSRGGRPDLAGSRLPLVQAPTLLIVGGRDPVVLDLNRRALASLQCRHRLSVVPGATHLFEESGALQSVAELAKDWFTRYLTPVGAGTPAG
jgi:predicted phosphoribosyltransferase/pimeloyl-ACP methyl ester carboxylesterase